MKKNSIILMILSAILFLIVIPANRKLKDKERKRVEKITKNFELVSAFDSFKLTHGRLIKYESSGDTIGYHHIKAKFEKDKILNNYEIDLSIKYAFMNQMYHGNEIKYSGKKDILLEADFYKTNKYDKDLKYRTVKYLIFKNREGQIKINKSLDIVDSLSINIPSELKGKNLFISRTYYDNIINEQITTNEVVETFVRNQKMYWTVRNILTDQSIGFNKSILLNITLIFALKPDFSIDTLVNWANVQDILIKRLNDKESNLMNAYPNQINEIKKLSNQFRDQISSRPNIENSIGYDAQIYYKLYSTNPFSSVQKGEMIRIYPLSQLPILIEKNYEFVNSYSDQTSLYLLKTGINYDLINEIDKLVEKPLLKNVISDIKYNHSSDYYLNNECIPYLIEDKYTMEISGKKMFKSTRMELLNYAP